MELYINTANKEYIEVSIKQEETVLFNKKEEAKFQQSEKLLRLIDKLLFEAGVSKRKLKKIRVADEGDGFSSLRIGVVAANALAYGLGIPVVGSSGREIVLGEYQLVRPKYFAEPNIGGQ
jgi:tRNA A37 threonylcarbamoyladenosine modification protein TsaB